ncbi:MAG TPA: GNAT family N-acetyltransferase [Ilumatobacteraceae bacterium]|nr:GNAT family N-acetyltransferase [Ilumatobacteraceae bacterium]
MSSIEIRAITPDEAVRYRRAIRAGFLDAETVDDEEWCREQMQPYDRSLATFDGPDIVASLASFPTELTLPGGATVPVGAVTAVTCRATHRRRGLLTEMIGRDLAASQERGEVADILIAAEYPIYGRFGYGPAVATTSWELVTGAATRFTNPGSGSVQFVDNATFRKEAPAIFDRLRVARPGMIRRDDLDWDVHADLRRYPEAKPWQGFRLLCVDDAGTPQGYASYTVDKKWTEMRPQCVIELSELAAATPDAEARLWRFIAELDLVALVKAGDRPTDEALPWLIDNGRLAKQVSSFDHIWVRPLDVARLLTTRSYATSGRVVIEVVDAQGHAGGRFLLDASPDGATCVATTESVELTMPVKALGAAALGGVDVGALARARWLDEHVAGASERAGTLLAGTVAPWCNTWF